MLTHLILMVPLCGGKQNEEFTPSSRVTQTESGEAGFEHSQLGYQRHALNHSAMLPFIVTE